MDNESRPGREKPQYLITFVTHADARRAMYEKLFLSGMVPTKDAVRSFIKMQADGNSKIVNLSSYELQKISKTRLHII